MVIQGAKALAVPTVLGQELKFSHNSRRKTRQVNWISKIHGDVTWYSNQFLIDNDFEPAEQANSERTEFIRSLLIAIDDLNPDFFKEQGVYNFKTFMDFDPGWGLGSSSSLISNLGMLTDLQPFELLFHSSLNQGSGYDVAVSYMGQPLLYNIEEEVYHWAEPTELAWEKFASKCRLVYLNRKQDSNLEVKRFKSKWKEGHNHNTMKEISEISERLPAVTDYQEFCDLLAQHELIMSEVLKQKCIKEDLFPDFAGVIKSLGAWGGDFILACPEGNPEMAEQYFFDKGYHVVIDFGKMIDVEWKS
jgi:mevalonate kinase